MDYKKAFYSKLEDCYLGVKIKEKEENNLNKNGFTNLLQLKKTYFDRIKDFLETKELSNKYYNQLYNFFDSYLNETGTPFFYDTPLYKNIYAKIYSNSKDTSLFYKTKDLYYVKSDALYTSLTLSSQDERYTLNFNANFLAQNASNKKTKIYFYLENLDENTINIKVSSQKENDISIFKQNSNEFSDDFLKVLKNTKIIIKEDELKKLFSSYKKQNEVDFFIHKNAFAFLKEQFDLWFFNYVSDLNTDWSKEKINDINELKSVAYELINFIADFENELKAIWLKPKFAKNTNYVFSYNILKQNLPKELLQSIIDDKKIKEQIAEWFELKLIDENFELNNLDDEKYQFLPFDTKYLSKENFTKLLSVFSNLDEILNGELVKSDNFQALNSLMPKYQGKIDLIYIDPPFNTGGDFEYKDKFQDSTWLSLMHNRLELAKEFLSNKGSFYLHLDHNANYRGRELLNEVFGEENFVNEVIWSYRSGGASKKESLPRKHDNIWLYSKTNTFYINPLYERQYYEINFMGDCKQDKEGRYYVDTLLRDTLEGEIKISKGDIIKTYNVKPVLNLSSEHIGFGTQKPEGLLHLLFDIGSNENSVIFDYHLGSGTTIAVAHKLNHKWLGIEMGEHFYKVIVPRIKKVIAGFACGISKEVDFKGGGAFRYYELESYEEALENCEYILDENKIIDYKKSRKLIKGLKKDENICLDLAKFDENFDIFVTLSNLMGLKIKRIFTDENGVKSCEFENDEIIKENDLDLIKYPKIKNLIWWEK